MALVCENCRNAVVFYDEFLNPLRIVCVYLKQDVPTIGSVRCSKASLAAE